MDDNVEPIPLVDLVSPHLRLENQLVEIFRDALRTGRFIGGEAVEAFEEDFADFCQTRQAIGVGNGTDALRFALIASGVGPGDLVLTVPNTFIATTEAISQSGGIPAFIDVDPITLTMDPVKLRDYLDEECFPRRETGKTVHRRTGRTVSAVVPVHLYGQTADIDPLLEIAEENQLSLIEDACQSHGAEYLSTREGTWRRAGSMGRAAAFSFYPGKNLGACGEAGAVATQEEAIGRTVRMLRDHGQTTKYFHEIEGYNGRLDAIQAGVLSLKLKHLHEGNQQRRRIAQRYNELLGKIDGITLPAEPPWSRGVYHLYVIRSPRREELRKALARKGIATGLHYPLPLHLQKAYVDLGYRPGDFPVAEKAASEILSLPIFPELTEAQQMRIVETLSWNKRTERG